MVRGESEARVVYKSTHMRDDCTHTATRSEQPERAHCEPLLRRARRAPRSPRSPHFTVCLCACDDGCLLDGLSEALVKRPKATVPLLQCLLCDVCSARFVARPARWFVVAGSRCLVRQEGGRQRPLVDGLSTETKETLVSVDCLTHFIQLTKKECNFGQKRDQRRRRAESKSK